VPGKTLRITFSAALDQDLTWDAAQVHPSIAQVTDMNGRAVFPIKGGGCSRVGTVGAYYNGSAYRTWEGAKSVDMNGDCRVRTDDVDAVRAKLGTADFCADLDGNGVVDTVDVAMVEGALGTHCPSLAAVEQDPAVAPQILQIAPNPCRDRAVIRCSGGRATLRVRVYDVNGRLVRLLERGGDSSGGDARIEWDTRDDSGRLVSSGFYAVSADVAGVETRRTLLVVR
jgi:hypothetical protein